MSTFSEEQKEREHQQQQEEQSLSLDACDADREIKLITKDGGVFSIPFKYAQLSELVNTAIQSDPNADELPLDFESGYLNATVLQLIVNYLMLRKGESVADIPEPIPSSKMSDFVASSDATFIDELYDQHGIYVLYDVISAANYLHIKNLLQLGCAKLAALVKNKPVKDIPFVLNPENRTKPQRLASSNTADVDMQVQP